MKALALIASLHLGGNQLLHGLAETHPPRRAAPRSSAAMPLNRAAVSSPAQVGRHITQLVKLAGAGAERIQLPSACEEEGACSPSSSGADAEFGSTAGPAASSVTGAEGSATGPVPNAIFLAGMLTASRPTDSTYRTTCPHPYQAALDRARQHDPFIGSISAAATSLRDSLTAYCCTPPPGFR